MNNKFIAVLQYDGKHSLTYVYGTDKNSTDGKITISKRFFSNEDADYLSAIDCGEISITNCCGSQVFETNSGDNIDVNALTIISKIQDKYDSTHFFPSIIEI